MTTQARCVLALLLSTAVLRPAAGQTPSGSPKLLPCWLVDTAASTLTVHVRPSGLFEAALHEHRLVPAEWRGRVCVDPANPRDVDLELVVQADSLEDRQPELDADDIAKVERQVRGDDVLDASRYPEIRYAASRFTTAKADSSALTGTLNGELSLHGTTRAVEVPVTVQWKGDRLQATGKVDFEQSDFGIEPYSKFLGTVGVEDRVTVEFAIDAVQR